MKCQVCEYEAEEQELFRFMRFPGAEGWICRDVMACAKRWEPRNVVRPGVLDGGQSGAYDDPRQKINDGT